MSAHPDPIDSARQLLAGSFSGILSTQSQAQPGYPFGSLVTFCLDYRGWPLFLLSHLAQHSRNLEADPHVALTLVESGSGDPLQRPRLCLLGSMEAVADGESDAINRYHRYYPDGPHYFSRLNFHFYRLRPERAHIVAGFGLARWLDMDRLITANPFQPREEELLLRDLNQNLQAELGKERPRLPISAREEICPDCAVVGVDAWGLDMRQNEGLQRLPFAAHLGNFAQVMAALGEIDGPPIAEP